MATQRLYVAHETEVEAAALALRKANYLVPAEVVADMLEQAALARAARFAEEPRSSGIIDQGE